MSAPSSLGAAPELLNDTTYVPLKLFELLDDISVNIDNNKERKHLVTIMLMDKNYPNIKIEGGKMILWQDIQFQ